MQRFLCMCFLILCVCVVDLKGDHPNDCNGRCNEEVKCVSDCPPEKTCKTRGIKFSCLQNNKRCQHKCVCKDGFYRNLIGQCITGELCDRCPRDHEYYSCGGFCDNVCSELQIQNQTHCPIRNIKCNEKCYCEEGYARNEKRECVPIKLCRQIVTPLMYKSFTMGYIKNLPQGGSRPSYRPRK